MKTRLAAMSNAVELACSSFTSKLENDFAAPLVLGGVGYGRLGVAEWIRLLHFRPQQSPLRHFKKRRECFGALLRRRGFVPFVYPESGEAQVFENEHAVRNRERLQTHRA